MGAVDCQGVSVTSASFTPPLTLLKGCLNPARL